MPGPRAVPIVLSDAARAHLEKIVRQQTAPQRLVLRSRIVLLAAEGLGNDVIASRLDTPRQIVSKWRKRFCLWRLPGLDEQPRGGRPPRVSPRRRGRRQGPGV